MTTRPRPPRTGTRRWSTMLAQCHPLPGRAGAGAGDPPPRPRTTDAAGTNSPMPVTRSGSLPVPLGVLKPLPGQVHHPAVLHQHDLRPVPSTQVPSRASVCASTFSALGRAARVRTSAGTPPPRRDSLTGTAAPARADCRRCCSSATSSPNIRLYSVACSTGLVRCSRDLRSAIRRRAVSSRRRRSVLAYASSGSLAECSGSTASALSSAWSRASSWRSRSVVAQCASAGPAGGDDPCHRAR